MTEKIEQHLLIGTHISEASELIARTATEKGVRVEAMFNETLAYAEPGDSASEVDARWTADFNAKAEAYRKSPEGIARNKRFEAEKAANRAKAEALASRASGIDYTDLRATLQYLRECVDPLGWTYTTDLCPIVAKELRSHGYERNANCGDKFDGEDRENFARYLIGQALDGLESEMGIHGIFEKFHDQWKAKFAAAPLENPEVRR